MAILPFQIGKVSVLPKRFISSLKGTEILPLYIILQNLIKICQEDNRATDRHIDRQTHRNIYTDEI